ncbi:uncharacterized protein [Bemisia tabaci]|uniref:uncharacterized protein isoform X2 n=1 Tax=Bemisia tabaci TaxID=7038 RepID=UPI003B288E0F
MPTNNTKVDCIIFLLSPEVEESDPSVPVSKCHHVLFPNEFMQHASGKVLEKVYTFFSKTKLQISVNNEDLPNRFCEQVTLVEGTLRIDDLGIRLIVNEDILRRIRFSNCEIHAGKISGRRAVPLDEIHLQFFRRFWDQGTKLTYGHRKGGTIFHYAAKRNRVDLVEFLLKFKYCSGIDSPRSDGSTPLHIAVRKGHLELAEIFLELGANVHARVVKFLTGQTQLIPRNAESGQFETILLDCEDEPMAVDENFQDKIQREDSLTPLHLAVLKGHEDTVELLLRHGADVNARVMERHLGRTFTFSPLLIAVQRGHYEVADVLLRSGADVNTVYFINNEKKSIFLHAVLETDGTLTDMILTHKPSFSEAFNRRALLLALLTYKNAYRILFRIVGRHELSVSWENLGHENETELIFAAVHKSDIRIVEYFLRRNASFIDQLWKPPFLDSECTLLHLAAAFADEDMIEYLLKHGAKVDSLDGDGQTPSFFAVIMGNRRTLKCLIENGANISNYPELPFGAIFAGDPSILEILLLHGARVDTSFVTAKNTPFLPSHRSDEIILGKSLSGSEYDDMKCLFYNILPASENGDMELLPRGSLLLYISKGSKHNRENDPRLIDRGLINSSVTELADLPLIFYAVARNDRQSFDILVDYGALFDSKVCLDARSFSYLAVKNFWMSSESIFRTLLDYSFPQFDRSQSFEHLLARGSFGHDIYHENMYAKYLLRISCCGICEVSDERIAALWEERYVPLGCVRWDDYQKLCKEEIVFLKEERIGNTDLTLYDVLARDENRIANYSRNPGFASLLNGNISQQLRKSFPIYSSIILSKVEKFCRRNDLMAQGIRLYSFYFEDFSDLPFDVKELIVNYVPTYDLKVLNTATLNRLQRCIS